MEKDKYCKISLICGKNKQTDRQKQTYRDTRLMITKEEVGWSDGGMGKKGQLYGNLWKLDFSW